MLKTPDRKRTVVCDECGKEFQIKQIEKHDFFIANMHYRATYFSCPFCCSTYPMCIDSDITLSMKKALQEQGVLKPSNEIIEACETNKRAMKLFGVDLRHINEREKR